jgi:histidine triad (HIT) family protein
MNTCVFCSFIQTGNPHHEKVWEDEKHVAFLSIEPVAEGHTLVVPKAHTEYVFDMDEASYVDLMKAVHQVGKILKEVSCKDRVLLAYEGFAVPHVHAHLIPENRDDGGVRFDAHPATTEELARVATSIREKM